ncbi:hypothetical protein KSP35_10515 [Aquihabitans sp. G128]|uniref:arsenate reductase/protein-tyrosine-phosphatase family protein n=1 Tax=Aquihabitans sp. G128 TaxID=2849779 RepID=UPI001C24C9DA|nr:hypothetical protein KSP35_10515 [Aquihabitans sp. G128]
MAEALLRRRLKEAGVSAIVTSTGFRFDGRPAEPGAIAALAKLGIDARPHRSSTATAERVAEADLVLTMEQAHVRDLAVLPEVEFAKVFTFPDAVERAEQMGPRGQEPFEQWVRRMGAGRAPSDLLASRPDLEVPDPMGGSKRAFRTSAAQIDDLCRRFVAVAFAEPGPDDVTSFAHRPTPGSI